MNRNRKKLIIFLIAFILLVILAICIFLIKKQDKVSNIETNNIGENEITNNTLETNTILNETEITQVKNAIQEETTKDIEQTKGTTIKETKDNKLQETQATTNKNQSKTIKSEENKNAQTEKNTSQKPNASNNPSNENKQPAPPKQEESKDTIKRITESEFVAEKSKYLSDIKSIAPNLKYVYSKRGQVFWPYRTSEISVAVGSVSFGTVYYYIEKFVEGNQEKFKYYIDWAGN